MQKIKVSDNFTLCEFIDPVTYDRFGAKSQRYIDPNIIKAAQYLRSITGLGITINNWATGGPYKESGLRNFETSTGAKYSAHKFGRAADLKIGDLNSFEMWDLIQKHEEVLMEKCNILRVEDPEYTKVKYRSWIHIDTLFNGGLNEIILIKP
jgi:hypothetical protein